MSLRLAQGHRIEWIDTRKESGFSNFLFVDQRCSSHPVMRRIFSLARKQRFQSVLIEELRASDCATIAADDVALARRQSDFTRSHVQRFSFLRSLKGEAPGPDDFIGSAIFRSDSFSGFPSPRHHVYEALIPPPRDASENNFIHCSRQYRFHTSAGDFAVKGVHFTRR
jgi:hypothetical protein